jgi:serine phosphatase RsbU (regulator of sigma subunit)/streptogramin lyase
MVRHLQGGGVSKYDGKSFTTFTTAQGLANNIVLSIAEDKNGNLWFGTQGGGVSKYDGKSFTTFTTAQGLANNSVRSIAEDKNGNLWFGTDGGVSKYDGKSFTTFTTAQGLANNSVFSIAEDKNGNLWFGTYGGGVSKYDGKSFTTFTTAQGLANNIVRSIAEDKNGNLWFGTYGGGVSKYDGKSFTTFTTAQGLANNSVFSIAEDKNGNLWFGTYGGGVSKYDGKSFTTFTTAQGLANNSVLSIAEDKNGNLWFGTAEGLSVGLSEKLAKKNDKVKEIGGKNTELFTNYTKNDGLPDNFIAAVREDKQGNIVFGTNFGLFVISQEEAKRIATPANGHPSFAGGEQIKGVAFNQFTGYPVRDVNAGQDNGTMLVDSKGIIWVGHGSNGVTSVDLKAVNKNTAPPKVIIQSVSLNEENICWYNLGENETDSATSTQQEMMTYGSLLPVEKRESSRMKYSEVQFDGITRFYPLPQNLVLPYEHNSVSFEFVGVETGRNFLVRYQYMMEGYDKDWSPITQKTSANFGNIYEGTYTFKLKARSPEGVWSEPVTYTFKVLPPWYRSWWMYTVYGLSAIGLVVLIVWWNGRKLRERAKLLTEEVRKATVEIRNQKEEVEKAHEKLAEHHKEITDSIHYAKRIQDAILPSISSMNENLKDGFLLFRPKDVVAGDFYWLEPKGDTVYFAAADCTGHGVPGAMVSVVCSYALSKALLEENITDTGKLLDRTRELVIERFAKSGEEVKDGMDISLCALNTKTLELQWSGANNPLWILRKKELLKYKPDKMPIGNYADPKPFATHDIQLEKEDIIYIFSDGYLDQFGGPKGKKYMSTRLSELILSVSSKTMDEQKELLQKSFEDWKGTLEQVDDVCMIGVKV